MDFLTQYLDLGVYSLLGIMAFIALWATIERLMFYRQLNLADYDHYERLQVALTNNLTYLSTIGANAPYIGLLGTVLGILITFYDLGLHANLDTGVIMTSLAIALKATAGGIMLAIPSIVSYNSLMRKVDVFSSEYRALQDISHLKTLESKVSVE